MKDKLKQLAKEMGNAGYCNYAACQEFLQRAFDLGAESSKAKEGPVIECGSGKYKYLLNLDEPGNLKQLVIEFLKWDGGDGSRAYDAQKYRTLRDALQRLVAEPTGQAQEAPKGCPDCNEAAKHAYSDATTAGFFSPKCSKHSKE